MRNKILSVFASYCDAYLEYANNPYVYDDFVEHYWLDEEEAQNLLIAVRAFKKEGGCWREIDYWYNHLFGRRHEISTPCY
ncbi:MAG: hypothetical protein K5854_01615 [Prevotella sp.]|nr:hypothetical protein [Prevotella sp.]